MATTRKKQDEKNMKTLREIASWTFNKYCFDCNQRGPTYVNVTIGSFICTKCSGLLRGLTPPHRVKSISMATFTTDEVEFLKSRGNHNCRRTWLGLYEGDVSQPRDDQGARDFMVDKYERKRYYIDVPPVQGPPAQSNTTIAHSVPSQNRPIEIVPRHNRSAFDFVADFESADIYNAVSSNASINNNVQPFANTSSNVVNNNNNPSDWNFTNFNVAFDQTPVVSKSNNNIHNVPTITERTPVAALAPTADRYAALKDLDSVFKMQPQLDWNLGSNGSSSPSSSLYSSPSEHGSTYGSSHSVFPQDVPKVSNPFNTKIQWGGDETLHSSANPFRTNDTTNNLNGVASNLFKSAPFESSSTNAWTPNPFTVPPSNSFNPFL